MSLLPELNAVEARVIGCLVEKSIVTPDQYPLTLNALTNACNQKTSREPVMSLSQGEVQHAIRALSDKHLVMVDENFRGRAEKYSQRFCNTRYSELQFDGAELAVVTLLLLRGPQTPGELKSRAGRLHSFSDNDEVADTLGRLTGREPAPVIVRLARRPGRRDNEYMHLFSGAVDAPAAHEAPAPATQEVPAAPSAPAPDRFSDLEDRVERLEAQVASLVAALGEREGGP